MTKYKKYLNKMLEENQNLFASFEKIHQKYMKDRSTHQQKFNSIGSKVVETVRDYEARLCGHSEKGVYAKFSANLAEKFQAEVKKIFPLIDFVGVTIETTKTPDPLDNLTKIKVL